MKTKLADRIIRQVEELQAEGNGKLVITVHKHEVVDIDKSVKTDHGELKRLQKDCDCT